MNIEELKRLAEAATPGPWAHGVTWIEHLGGIVALGNTARSKQDVAYVAAANPAAILELIAEMERLREDADDLTIALESSEKAIKDYRANDYTAIGYLADCRIAVGDNGKRMLPEFVEYLRQLKQQRDELLAKLDRAQAEIRELESKLFDATTKPIRTCEACATYPCKCE